MRQGLPSSVSEDLNPQGNHKQGAMENRVNDTGSHAPESLFDASNADQYFAAAPHSIYSESRSK